jgi:hypothetical protein
VAYKVYKVERKIASTGYWYEVMLSPFLRVRDAGDYIDYYKQFYPKEEQDYRVLDHYVDSQTHYRIKRFFDKLPKYESAYKRKIRLCKDVPLSARPLP